MKVFKIQNNSRLNCKKTKIFFDVISLKKSLYHLIILFFLILFFSCNMKKNLDGDKKNTSSIISMDSLLNLAQEKCEIIEVKLLKDTLLMVSTNDVLYYPFGEYRSLEDFLLTQPFLKDNIHDVDSTEKDFKIITLESANNHFKFIESKESGNLEIIDAEIKDNCVNFSNGVKVGMSKKVFLSKFFYDIPNELKNVSVVEFESALTGIWHYYLFSENKLRRVSIISDYQIDN